MTLTEHLARWATCKRCGLCLGRTHVVAGGWWKDGETAGAPLILIVGEAPGKNEDERGEPFVGAAGEVLRNDVLHPAGVRWAYITNALGCRPPGNRDPLADEISACAGRVKELLSILEPDGIVCVGRHAERALQSGTWGELKSLPYTAIVHPAALLRKGYPNMATRATMGAQVGKVKRLLARVSPIVPVEDITRETKGVCEHVLALVGAWMRDGKRESDIVACTRCGRIVEA